MNFLHSVFSFIGSKARFTPDHYIQIESDHPSPKMSSNFVTKAGGLASVFRVDGNLQHLSDDVFKEKTKLLEAKLRPHFKRIGFEIEFFYECDKSLAGSYSKSHYSLVNKSLKKIGLHKDRLLRESVGFMSDILVPEQVMMVVTTSPSILTKRNYAGASEKRNESNPIVKAGEYCQNPTMLFDVLVDIHNAFSRDVADRLGGFLSLTPVMPVEFLQDVKNILLRISTERKWNPALATKRGGVSVIDRSFDETDLSSFLAPSIGAQLFNDPIERDGSDSTIVRHGSYYYAPIYLDTSQQTIESFNSFLSKCPKHLPVRANFKLTLGSDFTMKILSRQKNKAMFAKLINDEAKFTQSAVGSLIDYANSQKTLLCMQATFCTWGKSIQEAQENKEEMLSKLQGWGGLVPATESMDSEGAFLNSLPLMSDHHIEPYLPIRLTTALEMLPINRAGNPFSHGSLLLRTVDGRPFPVEQYSSLQASWSFLLAGLSGYGKSVLIKMLLDSILSIPGSDDLPRGGVLDIGYSASLWVKSVQEFGDDRIKSLVEARRLQNSERECINFMDTPLGIDHPLPMHRENVIAFFQVLLSNDKNDLPDGFSGFIPMLVDEMYLYKANVSPNAYFNGMDEIDSALNEIGFTPGYSVSWREVTDMLFKAGKIKEAQKAHKLAMPIVSDAIEVIESVKKIRDQYSELTISGGSTPFLSYAKLRINEAIKTFKNISRPTNINTDARIIVLDLQDVCLEALTPQQKKMNTFYYMLGIQLTTADFFFSEDSFKDIPTEEYRDYHQRSFQKNKNSKNFLFVDEWHRSAGTEFLTRMFLRYQRESRKYEMLVGAASQSALDFDNTMTSMATTLIVLSCESEDEEQHLVKNGQVDPNTLDAAKLHHFRKPDKQGSRLLLRMKSGHKTFSQLLFCTAPSYEIWDASTTTEDVELINMLTKKLNSRELALLSLSRQFGTSAKGYIDNEKLNLAKQGLPATNHDVYTKICSDIEKEHLNGK